MDDAGPSDLRGEVAAAIGQLFDVSLDLAAWAERDEASLDRIEPLMRDVDRAVRELGSVMSVLCQLEHLPDVRPVGARLPSLDSLAEQAPHIDPVIPDGIHLRLQQALTARTALWSAKSSQDVHLSSTQTLSAGSDSV